MSVWINSFQSPGPGEWEEEPEEEPAEEPAEEPEQAVARPLQVDIKLDWNSVPGCCRANWIWQRQTVSELSGAWAVGRSMNFWRHQRSYGGQLSQSGPLMVNLETKPEARMHDPDALNRGRIRGTVLHRLALLDWKPRWHPWCEPCLVVPA